MRAFLHGHSKATVNGVSKSILRKGMIRGSVKTVFQNDHAQCKRPAAIRRLGETGKVPVTGD
jgi:hypothetical protein